MPTHLIPGEYEVHTLSDQGHSIAVYDEQGQRLDDRLIEERARLVAAAPDLLEALREVVGLSDRKHVAWDKARALIAALSPERKEAE